MVRINKEEIKGNCDKNRKVAGGDNHATDSEGDKGGGFCCEGDECHIEWTDD